MESNQTTWNAQIWSNVVQVLVWKLKKIVAYVDDRVKFQEFDFRLVVVTIKMYCNLIRVYLSF